MFIQFLLTAFCLNYVHSTTTDNNVTKEYDDFIAILANPVKDEFDWRLFQKFSASKGYKNVIISPVSLKLVLAILYEGSAGLTQKEFQTVLKFPADKNKLREEYNMLLDTLIVNRQNYIINIGTQLFLDNRLTVQPTFAAKASHFYHAEVAATNFTNTQEASSGINSWVEYLTNGRIKKLVSPGDLENTVLLAANAIFFKGLWLKPFPKDKTYYGDFYVSKSEAARVPYMTQTDLFYHCDSKALGAQILRLPYLGKKFGLYIILPYNKDGLSYLLDNIDLNELTLSIRLSMSLKNVSVILPKFRYDFQTKYSEILRDFGFETLFRGISSFPGIVRDQQLQLVVSDILQKSGIDVNEDGSVVYSATQVTLSNKFGGEPTIPFNVTHPFMFFIEEQTTRNILFMGKIENPLDIESLPPRFGGSGIPPQAVALSDTSQVVPAAGPYPIVPATVGSQFDIELLKNAIGSSKNVLISPSSVKVALATLGEAAVGTTADQIYNVLGIPYFRRNQIIQSLVGELSELQPHSELVFENALFVSDKQKLKEKYKTDVERFYKTRVKQLNFNDRELAALEINGLIKNATRGFIPGALSPDEIDSNTAIILTNVLYFKGDWFKIFENKLTKITCFHTPKGCVDVPLMHIIDMFYYGETPNAHIVKLDYTGFQRAMLLVVPKQENGLLQALKDVEQHTFEELLTNLNHTEVELYLPKFEINFGHDIANILKKMGVRQVFESNSNISNLLEGDKQHFVDAFVHKTRIEVTEEGTEASALSLVSVIPLMGTSTPNVRADHPFAFFIYNTRTNTILFEGVLNEPENNNNQVIAQQKTANTPPYTYAQAVQTQGRNNLPTQQEQALYRF